ncbi:hypothetical protein QFC19_008433 [Naganishia cerealis]|uniref:Uncharacterized protein n=1 Tax=Naganishia cerealis TaxID=610337 RepID=A0ACC2V3S9_9TREE|nr:hypothetical protein QFC19_008433 [Naganishia cerealis]
MESNSFKIEITQWGEGIPPAVPSGYEEPSPELDQNASTSQREENDLPEVDEGVASSIRKKESVRSVSILCTRQDTPYDNWRQDFRKSIKEKLDEYARTLVHPNRQSPRNHDESNASDQLDQSHTFVEKDEPPPLSAEDLLRDWGVIEMEDVCWDIVVEEIRPHLQKNPTDSDMRDGAKEQLEGVLNWELKELTSIRSQIETALLSASFEEVQESDQKLLTEVVNTITSLEEILTARSTITQTEDGDDSTLKRSGDTLDKKSYYVAESHIPSATPIVGSHTESKRRRGSE